MITDQKEWEFEKQRLDKVYDIIQRELEKRRSEIKNCRDGMIASRKEMWENVSSSPQQFEEMIEAQQHIDELKREWSKYQFAQNLVERMEKIALCPYFARVDFLEEGCSPEKIYIGALSLIDDNTREIYIYDWRAPVSGIFYDYELGPAAYKCLDGEIKGSITLKRQFRIFRNNIEYMFDSSIKIDDEILQRLMSKNADDKMRNIVSTIQREQNRVIRNEEKKVLIVQGVAGSGKTSIALHRAAYLLYRYRNENVNSKNIVIFSPNQIFNDYISDVLPELGEENIMQTTFLDFARSLLGMGYRYEDLSDQAENVLEQSNKDNAVNNRLTGIAFKASREFLVILKNYVKHLETENSSFEDIKYKGKTIVSKEELLGLFNNEYRSLPLAKRLEKIKDRILFLMAPFEKEELMRTQEELENDGGFKGEIESAGRLITSKKFKDIRDTIDSLTGIKVFDAYSMLFERKGLMEKLAGGASLPCNLDDICSETLDRLSSGYINYEDLSPILFLKGEIEGVGGAADIKHVIVDEAQDYSLLQHEVFRQHFGHISITLLGDVSQSIYLHSRGDSETIAGVFCEGDSLIIKLTKSYRSTKEIIDFSRAILGNNAEIEPVIRGGKKPTIKEMSGENEMICALAHDAADILKDGAKSIAIICKTAKSSQKVYNSIKDKLEVSLMTKNDDEFKKGIVVIPSYLAKGLEFDAVLVHNANAESYGREDERKLLYVSCTRALHILNIYYSGEISTFISGIDKELYIEEK